MPNPFHLIVTIAVMALAAPSQACGVILSPAQHVARGYRTGAISTVALVRVTEAHYTQAAFGDAHPWRATATVERVLRGPRPGRSVSFARGFGSAVCDDGRALPAVGERWVVYFRAGGGGDQAVWNSWPAPVAFAADPSIGARR